MSYMYAHPLIDCAKAPNVAMAILYLCCSNDNFIPILSNSGAIALWLSRICCSATRYLVKTKKCCQKEDITLLQHLNKPLLSVICD